MSAVGWEWCRRSETGVWSPWTAGHANISLEDYVDFFSEPIDSGDIKVRRVQLPQRQLGEGVADE